MKEKKQEHFHEHSCCDIADKYLKWVSKIKGSRLSPGDETGVKGGLRRTGSQRNIFILMHLFHRTTRKVLTEKNLKNFPHGCASLFGWLKRVMRNAPQ
ncbi:MAG: hypothetical protein ACKOYP_02010, partial [Bacteroidota bacterium]